jgi:uncharacterized SAM-binding protein YcdF (DUF218 family)
MMIKIVAFICLVIAVIVGIAHYLGPDDLAGCAAGPTGSGCEPADAIVAISGGDTAARAGEAIKLYQNGWAPKLIFSGAALDKTGPSNAAVMRDIAVKAGVPDEDILVEENSQTTRQNAQETRALFGEESISSIILVTSAYHQRRASLEFKRSFEGIEIRNHPVKQDRQWSQWWWTTPGGWYLVIGELAKIGVLYLEGLHI